MAFDPISAGLGLADTLIKRVWPDPNEQAAALQRLEELKQKGDLAFLEAEVKALLGQVEINKIEAASQSLFKSGWRPFIGWCCGIALAYKFIGLPFLLFAVNVSALYLGGPVFDVGLLPALDWAELSMILMGMLGLGGLRTYEKRTNSNNN